MIPVAAAPAAGEKQGVLKAFDAKSVTISVNGKNVKYTVDTKTVVKRIDQEVDLMDTAKKGMVVTYKTSGSKLTYINLPNIGAELQGSAKIAVSDLRVTMTDSSYAANSDAGIVDAATGEVTQTTITRVKEIGYEEADDYSYDDVNLISLGEIVIDPATVKVVLNGKELKVLADGKEFDPAVVGDEVKLAVAKEDNTITFETAITDKEGAEYEDIEKILKVTYKKKVFEISTTETNLLPVDANGVVELNGKETTLTRATTMGNYWYVRTNPEGYVIHADAFFRDADAVITYISKGTVKVNIIKNGKVIGNETLTLSAGVNIQAANGSVIAVSSLKVNDKVKITTEPAEGYKVTSIIKK